MDTTAVVGKNAFSIKLKDASPKVEDATFDYLDEDDVTAELTIQLTMGSGEWYRYVIEKVSKEWQTYTIAFKDFELFNEKSLVDDPNPLTSDKIIHMAFGFKYFYLDEDGKGHPTYAIANPVYLDDVCFTNASETSNVDVPGIIKPDSGDTNKITIDTMEGYSSTSDVLGNWFYPKTYEYSGVELSNDVSNAATGGTHSIKLHYQGTDIKSAATYSINTPFSKSVLARAISFDMKGDGKATVYLDINWRMGSTLFKMRYCFNKAPATVNQLENVPATWSHYELGFALFRDADTATNKKTINQKSAKDIESITITIVGSDNVASDIYLDNLRLINPSGYSVNTRNTIA